MAHMVMLLNVAVQNLWECRNSRPSVEHLDVIEQVGSSFILRPVDLPAHPLLLQRTEKRLGQNVVPAVATPTHVRLQN